MDLRRGAWQRILPQTQAYFAAILFAANPYHLIIIYHRSDFAELLASALFPLLILGTLRVFSEAWRRVPLLAIVFGGIWLLNGPAAVIVTYVLVLLLVLGCIFRRSLGPFFCGVVALIWGFGLAAFYILPAAWEQRWIKIARALEGGFLAERNFLFAQNYYPERPRIQAFNWKVSAVAVGVMAATAIGVVLCRRYIRKWPELWWILFVLAGSSTFLMFPPSAFLWRHLPKLAFLQFPWRWLMPFNFVLAFFVAAALSKTKPIWLFVVMLVLVPAGTAIVADIPWNSDFLPFLTQEIRAGHGYLGVKHFAPIGSSVGERYEERPLITTLNPADDSSGRLQLNIQEWTAKQRIFTAHTSTAVILVLHLLNYPAWEVRVDGQTTPTKSHTETGQLMVPLERGTHQVEVRFRRTWDRTAGGVISVLSFVALVLAALYARRRPAITIVE